MLYEVITFGMDGLLNYRKADLSGILNGIDYSEWDPEKDEYIKPDNFSEKRISGKNNVKKRLQQEMGLHVKQSTPLIGIVTRLVDQKGRNNFV